MVAMMEKLGDNRSSGFLSLPPEVLENIFADLVLGVNDLCSLCQTCSVFREVLENNSLWRAKFCQRWPRLYYEVGRRKSVRENSADICWKSIIRQRIIVKHTVIQRLEDMAHDTRKRLIKYQKAVDEIQFYNFCELLLPDVDPELQIVFIVDELQRILYRSHEWQNLTVKFYAERSLWFFHHQLLLPEVEKFVATTSSDEQDLEIGATIIAQWFQPRSVFTVEEIKHEFDSLANLTKETLKTINPEHPVLSDKPSNVWGTKSLWSPGECRQIIQAIETVIKSSFNKGFNSYYTPSNSFINIVLQKKEGIPITLCLTVISVARRLGLALEPVNFPHHFILRWMEYPSKFGIDKYSFVDVFGGRYALRFQDLVESFYLETSPIVEAHCDRCTYQEVLHRMLRNLLNLGGHQRTDNGLDLLHHSVELAILFIPHDIELAILSAQVSLHLKINLPKALSRIQEAAGSNNAQSDVLIDLQVQCQHLLLQRETLRDEEASTSQDKHRRDHVKVAFAVGMIMRHKNYNYLCVIRGWDEQCQASEQWIKQMNVDKCERGRMQPFYNVWAMDGSDRYAAEENLVLTKETVPITHPEVGRLFETFTGHYYIPGPQLLADYPDDLNVTHDLVTKFFVEQQ